MPTVSFTIAAMWSGSLRWMKVPSPDSLQTTFGRAASSRMPPRHCAQPAGERSSSIPACCSTKVTLGQAVGEFAGTGHLAGEDLEVEAPAVVSKLGDVLLHGRVANKVGLRREAVLRVFVPVQLHPQATHAGIFAQPVELRAHVGSEEVGIADDRLRIAGFVSSALYVGDLVGERLLGPIGLHIDGADDVAAGDIGKVFADRIVAPDRLVGAEDARLHRPFEPGQIGPPPDVVMGVDNGVHAALTFARPRT